MSQSRIEQAVRGTVGLAEEPAEQTVATSTTLVLAAITRTRFLSTTNVGDNDIYLAIDHTAVLTGGIVVKSGEQRDFYLQAGSVLNGIADQVASKLVWQAFIHTPG